MKLNVKDSFKKGLKSAMNKLPLEFRWMIFGTLWNGFKISPAQLMKNRKAWKIYQELNTKFPTQINQKFEEVLSSEMDHEDIAKLKNIVSQKDAVSYQDILINANTITIETKREFVNKWRNTARQVMLEELCIIEDIKEEDLRDIMQGKSDKKIVKGLAA